MSWLLLALCTFVLAGAPQVQEPAVQPAITLEAGIRNAIILAPHYGVFDNLSYRLDGSDVTLLGQVLLPITKEEISRRVAKLTGVGKVNDEIKVLPLSRNDDALRLQVYRRVFGAADLYRYALAPNPSIHIIVNGGRVTLEGVVSNEGDSRYAFMAARKVNGVFSVTNNLTVQK
ncbi:MAG: BON domain-containing protein [Candidatus Aminicenantes bacterium]|nr:BON domain-containing protein [Candidatus Aminicenantes bacterium]